MSRRDNWRVLQNSLPELGEDAISLINEYSLKCRDPLIVRWALQPNRIRIYYFGKVSHMLDKLFKSLKEQLAEEGLTKVDKRTWGLGGYGYASFQYYDDRSMMQEDQFYQTARRNMSDIAAREGLLVKILRRRPTLPNGYVLGPPVPNISFEVCEEMTGDARVLRLLRAS